VIVVEHDEGTMRAADHLVDLGPGAAEQAAGTSWPRAPLSRQ
jgi:excinuclease UvrABC ATPase subunit